MTLRTANILAVIATVAALSCTDKKKLPEPAPDSPVFNFTGKADGAAIAIQAGNDGYYMASSHYSDSSNTVVYKGTLSQPGCTQCGYALTVLIKDVATGTGSVDNAIKAGHYLFDDVTPSPTEYAAKIVPDLAYDASGSYHWTVTPLDGSAAFESVGYEFIDTLKANVKYKVVMTFEDATGCSATHTNYFVPSAKLTTTVSAIKNMTATVPTYTFMCNTMASNFIWDFGDGSSPGSGWKPSHAFPLQSGKYYEVKLTLISSTGDSATTYYQVPGVTEDVCTSNFRASFTPLPVPPQFSRVTVLLTDPSGVTYSSATADQPVSSDFEVIASAPYSPNEHSEPTRRVSARFNCVVSGGTKQIHITDGQATFAVSY